MTRIVSRSLSISLIALSSFAIAAPSMAQRGGGGGGQGQGGASAPSMPSGSGSGDLDRLRDRDRVDVPDQDRDRDRIRDRTDIPDQDRDRLRDRDRDQLHINQSVEGQLSTWQLLTSEERLQFHQRMRSASGEQERNQIRAEHQAMIQQRAQDLGVSAPFGPQRSGNGDRANYFLAQTLTEQERLQFHQRMRSAANEQQREQIRTEMQTMARERARDMGVEVPAWFGQNSR